MWSAAASTHSRPPLIVEKRHIDEMFETLGRVLKEAA